MALESLADLEGMFEEHAIAQFSGVEIPGIYDSDHQETLGTSGYAPRFLCSGKRVDGDTSKLYGDGCDVSVSAGDTVTTIIDEDGDEHGPFTVLVIRPDGTGVVELQLTEA